MDTERLPAVTNIRLETIGLLNNQSFHQVLETVTELIRTLAYVAESLRVAAGYIINGSLKMKRLAFSVNNYPTDSE